MQQKGAQSFEIIHSINIYLVPMCYGFPSGSDGKEFACST